MVVELPGGDLLVCWFHGSGERTADDVVVAGRAAEARAARRGATRSCMADTPGYPDTNATIFLDPTKRLWLLWPTILANEWHTALMKYKIASRLCRRRARRGGTVSEVLHVTPGDEFAADRRPAKSTGCIAATPADRASRRPTPSSSRPTPRTSCSVVSAG